MVGLPKFEPLEGRRLFAAPALQPIGPASVPVGKTIQIPITTDYVSTSTVTYSIKTSGKSISLALHPATNTFVQIDVAGYADPMVFELFNDVAPNTVRRFAGLVAGGYYDGLTFHNVINNFAIQSGDPTGTGTGGLNAPIDDEFDPSTLFTGTAQLAMAQPIGEKDSSGSQFFITEGPQRTLDFNYTIFGQLVRGESTRAAISDVSVDGSYRPLTPVTISDAKVIADTTDAVLSVKAISGLASSVRVTATTPDGNSVQSFNVQPFGDTFTDPPVLNAVPKIFSIPVNGQLTTTLHATDLQRNAVHWEGNTLQGEGLSAAYVSDQPDGSGLLSVVPRKDFTGVIKLVIGVGTPGSTTRGNLAEDDTLPLHGIFDTQIVTVVVGQRIITATGYTLDLNGGNTSGMVAVASFRVADTTKSAANYTAKVDWGDGTSSTAAVAPSGRAGIFTVLSSKTYGTEVSGRVPVDVIITDEDGQTAVAQSTVTVRACAELAGGLLTIYGTGNNDRIGMSRKNQFYTVSVNGSTRAFPLSDVAAIVLYALAGRDRITVTADVVSPGYLDGGDGNDVIYGGGGPEIINAGAGNDFVQCGDGSNRVAGGNGNDTLTGGAGRDRLYGGVGNDYLYGGPGRDLLSGDAGDDTLLGGTSNDTLYGGDGNDVLNGMGGVDFVYGGPGLDRVKRDSGDDIRNDAEQKV